MPSPLQSQFLLLVPGLMDMKMEDEKIVIVIEGGIVTEVYSYNANARIIVVDMDNRKVGEDSVTEFSWPEIQFDDERVSELLGERI